MRTSTKIIALSAFMTSAIAQAVTLNNSGFEDSFTGWTDTDPSAISGDEYEGSKAAKITGSGGKFEQEVTVEANTSYTLSAYIEGSGEIGAIVDGDTTSTVGGDDDYEQVTVDFNSGSATSITIYGAYGSDEGRFDTFALESTGSEVIEEEETTTPSTATSVPALIEAEDYTDYSDTTSGNSGGEYTSDDVDVQVTSDTNGGYNVGWIKSSEWLEYSISVSTAGDYTADIRVASQKSTGSFDVSVDYSTTDSVDVGYTGGWQAWETRTVDLGTLSKGDHTIRIDVTGNNFNINWIDVKTETVIEEEVTIPEGDAEYPSDLMSNFDQWKMTFPDGEEEKQLEDVTNEYFYVNDTGNGIVFYAPVRSDNGTTPNSDYIRSELREREEDGSGDIYWTTTGTHVVYAKQAITHLPLVKDELVATQIHGNKDDGIDDAVVLRLEGSHLFLSFNGGKLRDDVTVKTDYELGTIHEVIFEVIDDKHYIYYSEDGQLNTAYAAGTASQYLITDGSDDFIMDLNYDQSYFKVGNYTQSNAEEEGDYADDSENYGEVVVYDFWVNHE